MSSQSALRTGIESRGLGALADEILALARPAIRVVPTPTALADLPIGASRIGGTPDLPRGTPWPTWKGEPQSFLGQFDLASLARLPASAALPSEGSLIFFYSARQDTWGFDPDDRESWSVIYAAPGDPLTRAEPPVAVPDGGVFPPCAVEFEETLTLPPLDSMPIDALALTDPQADAYADLLDAVTPEGHQLLGHPFQIQSDMTVECQLVSNGLSLADAGAWKDPRVAELEKGRADWRLLFQVDSDDAARMMWGDTGLLYFWIRLEDLAARAFDRTWMVLQCC